MPEPVLLKTDFTPSAPIYIVNDIGILSSMDPLTPPFPYSEKDKIN